MSGGEVSGMQAPAPQPIQREGDIEANGVTLLRGVADPAMLRDLLARIESTFAYLEGMPVAELVAKGAGEFRFHGALDLSAADPEMEILQGLHPNLIPSVRAFLGGDRLGFRNNIVRRIYPTRPESSSSFHQDLQFLKPYSGRMATIWIPLEPCDGTRPGLDILPMRLSGLAGSSIGTYLGDSPDFKPYVDRGPGVAHDSAVALTEDTVARMAAGQPLWRPRLAVGDVLVFDGYTIHRSGISPEMTSTRTSVELRCVPANEPPPA